MFKKIYKHLENHGFSVFSIGQHTGLCDKPYVVVKERGEQPFLTGLTSKWVDFIVFYPMGNYTEMQDYVTMLQDVLGDLSGLRNMNIVTPAVIDTQVRAYTVSVTYQIISKRRNCHE